MPEIDTISARLTVLETVMGQLITHLAVRSDNPRRWVETRKVLAMNVLAGEGEGPDGSAGRMRDALTGLFEQAELVAADYSFSAERGTPGPFVR